MQKGRFLRDDRAVSEVLGVILIIAIILSATSIYLSYQIPKWTKDFEAEHAAKVPHDFAKLSSNIDMAILIEDSTISTATPIGMRPESAPIIGIFSSGGMLSFDPDNETFECIACAPGETASVYGNSRWSSSSSTDNPYNFSEYAKYDSNNVNVTPSGARLELEKEEDKIFTGGTEYLAGEYSFDEFKLTNNTTVIVKGGMLKIHAKSIIIDAGSKLTADGEGWPGGSSEVDGSGDGYGGGADQGSGGGGGGYGVDGGDGGNRGGGDGAGSGGTSYGDAASLSAEMGSGGGGGGNGWSYGGTIIIGSGGSGGNGGGYIWLEASTIDISGIVSANGTDGEDGNTLFLRGGGGGGGGSGGCIIIKGDTVNISGMLYAVGGNGGDGGDTYGGGPIYGYGGGGGGGGAGGRIKVFYDSSDPGDINNYTDVSSGSGGEGGKGSGWWGDNGEDGDAPAGPGTAIKSSLPFTTIIPHYSSGWLVSNVTAVEGHAGHDVNTTLVRYGNITWNATVPTGTNIVMKVRTSMNPGMMDAMPWEDCPEVTNGQDISELASVSDGHRYIQWRAEFATFMPARTPVLHSVNISYNYSKPVLVNASGKIEFDSSYLYLPNYKLIYEHGAIIKKQTEGGFMHLSPPFSITTDEHGNTSLKITAIDLTGSGSSICGAFGSTVKAYYQDADLVTGGLNFLNLTFNITTEYPDVWERWFIKSCEEAGLDYGTDAGDFYTDKTGNTLQVVFYGNESKPVNLWLKKSDARIEIVK